MNTTAFPATSWIKASYRKHAQGRDAIGVHDEWHVVFALPYLVFDASNNPIVVLWLMFDV